MALTIEQLTKIATDFLREEYDLPLKIPIVRNNRLRRCMGRLVYKEDEITSEFIPDFIDLSGELLTYGAEEAIIAVLKHECVHYALELRGEPNDDGHPYFEGELKRLNVVATEKVYVGEWHVCRCKKCGKETGTSRKSTITEIKQNNPFYVIISNCCNSPLEYVRTDIYDGTRGVS